MRAAAFAVHVIADKLGPIPGEHSPASSMAWLLTGAKSHTHPPPQGSILISLKLPPSYE